jgi:Holliday junction resolvasome RuvABC endonuclease subunit
VLALAPSARGFGYAVFEGPGEIIDWGVQAIPSKERARRIARIEALVDWYAPDVIVVENYTGQGSRRGERTRRQIRAIVQIAHRRRIKVRSYSRAMIRQCFARFNARGKDAIARVIAREFPEMEPRLPPPRRPWMSEDTRMGMFDAAALALTHFYISSARESF